MSDETKPDELPDDLRDVLRLTRQLTSGPEFSIEQLRFLVDRAMRPAAEAMREFRAKAPPEYWAVVRVRLRQLAEEFLTEE